MVEAAVTEDEDVEALLAIAVEPPPMLIENCHFCDRLFVPPRTVEVLARSQLEHVRAYGCDLCAGEFEAIEVIEHAAITIERTRGIP